MIKNTAGQKIGVQMVSAADGSAFTGTVTVYVTVDAGTQAIGATSSGVCTHEGNGYHTYAPTQGETNGDLIAFTFIGTGAIPQTVQAATTAAVPTDSAGVTTLLARIGAFSGSGVNTVLGVLKSVVSKAATLPSDIGGTFDPSSDSTEAIRDAGSSGLDGAGVRTALGMASANMDTQLSGINSKTINLPSDPADESNAVAAAAAILAAIPTTAAIADKVLGRNLAGSTDGGHTVKDALRVLRNKVTISGTTLTVYGEDNITPAWTGVVTRAAADAIAGVVPS